MRGPAPRSAWERVRAGVADERFQLAALLLLALLIRLAFHFRSPALVGKDSQSYFLPGWEIARGEPFELGQRRTPGYPLFIAGVIVALGEELRSLALAQHLLGVATVAATYLLGRLTFGRATGLLAGLLVAVSGPLLIYERYVMSETLFGFTLVLTLLATVVAVRAQRWWLWLLAGLSLGAAVLTRPVAQSLIPLLGLVALLASGQAGRRGLIAGGAVLLGVAVVQAPWVVRNALVTGNAATSTFGRTLIARTAYYDRGFVFDVPGQPDPDPRMQRAREIVQDGARRHESDGVIAGRLRAELGLGPAEVNRVMRDIAVSAILRDPERYARGTLAYTWEVFVGVEERVRDHWEEYKDINPWDPRIRGLVGGPTLAEQAERANANKLAQIYQPTRYHGPLAAFFLLGLAFGLLIPHYRVTLVPASVAALLLVVSAALNGPVERYRYPLDPLISVVAAGGLIGGAGLLVRLARRRAGTYHSPSDGLALPLEREADSAIPSPAGRGLG